MLAVVRLPLEGDVAVCVALHEEPHDPFGKVAEVEPHIQQFFHLLGMDRLVIDSRCRQRTALFAGEDDTEQIDCGKTFERDDVVVNDFHSKKFSISSLCVKKSSFS